MTLMLPLTLSYWCSAESYLQLLTRLTCGCSQAPAASAIGLKRELEMAVIPAGPRCRNKQHAFHCWEVASQALSAHAFTGWAPSAHGQIQAMQINLHGMSTCKRCFKSLARSCRAGSCTQHLPGADARGTYCRRACRGSGRAKAVATNSPSSTTPEATKEVFMAISQPDTGHRRSASSCQLRELPAGNDLRQGPRQSSAIGKRRGAREKLRSGLI